MDNGDKFMVFICFKNTKLSLYIWKELDTSLAERICTLPNLHKMRNIDTYPNFNRKEVYY